MNGCLGTVGKHLLGVVGVLLLVFILLAILSQATYQTSTVNPKVIVNTQPSGSVCVGGSGVVFLIAVLGVLVATGWLSNLRR